MPSPKSWVYLPGIHLQLVVGVTQREEERKRPLLIQTEELVCYGKQSDIFIKNDDGFLRGPI